MFSEYEVVRGSLEVISVGQDLSSAGAECNRDSADHDRACQLCRLVDRFIGFYRDFCDSNDTTSKRSL